MRIGVPSESAAGERRVALVPEVVAKLVPAGLEVVLERSAGEAASFPDADDEKAGAQVVDDPYDAAAVVKVQKPVANEAGRLREDQVLIGLIGNRFLDLDDCCRVVRIVDYLSPRLLEVSVRERRRLARAALEDDLEPDRNDLGHDRGDERNTALAGRAL